MIFNIPEMIGDIMLAKALGYSDEEILHSQEVQYDSL